MKYLVFFILTSLSIACGQVKSGENKIIDDLPFNQAEDAKAYADLVLRAIKTNRDEPVRYEFEDPSSIDKDSLDYYISMYSTGIGGRNDWDFIDVYGGSEIKKETNEFDYAWLDPSGRLGIQLKIIPVGTSNGFKLGSIELRSRLDIMKSVAFPGGAISDYEKIVYDWDTDLKRKLEKAQK